MDDIEIHISVGNGMVGCRVEDTIAIDREEWAGMTEEEREQYCFNEMLNMIEWNYEVSE